MSSATSEYYFDASNMRWVAYKADSDRPNSGMRNPEFELECERLLPMRMWLRYRCWGDYMSSSEHSYRWHFVQTPLSPRAQSLDRGTVYTPSGRCRDHNARNIQEHRATSYGHASTCKPKSQQISDRLPSTPNEEETSNKGCARMQLDDHISVLQGVFFIIILLIFERRYSVEQT